MDVKIQNNFQKSKPTIIEAAEEYISENMAAIPEKGKAPALPEGSIYFQQRIPEEKIKQVFNGSKGIGIRCGSISEGIECIDFDDHDGTHGINDIIRKIGRNEFVQHLIQEGKIYIERTPSGGWHFIYRYEAKKYEGGKNLAYWQDNKVMIETRAEGQQVIVYPSPGYEQRENTLTELVTIEKEERDQLIEIAKEFDLSTKEKKEEDENDDLNTEPTDPVSLFNIEKTAYAKKLLEDEGWQKIEKKDGIEKWKRPGKKEGISATWGWRYNALYVFSSSADPFQQHCYYTPFQIMVKLRFKGKYKDALSYLIRNQNQKNESDIPYIRVGTDYFKVIQKPDAFGFTRKELKHWSKEEIKQDYGKHYLDYIPPYDDFILNFDYKNHKEEINGCYNLAQPMIHTPAKGEFPWTKELMRHVFGEQIDIGYKYLKLLYEHPHHIAPILGVVSKERGTGKTTLIQWLSMIFGGNTVILGNQDLANNFNSTYADKHLVFIEEGLIDRAVSLEKLKSLSTAKQITVNKKFVSQYTLPFHGKIIISSNNEDKFVRVDQEEVRYFVRKLSKPKFNNPNILKDLKEEIPAFLHYLTEMEPLDFSKDRAVFTPEELDNGNLKQLKHESKSNLYKNLEEHFTDFFLNEGKNYEFVFCSVGDIKTEWFAYNNNTDETYIRHVLRKEFNKESKLKKYKPFGRGGENEEKKTGRVYKIEKSEFVTKKEEDESDKAPF